MIKLNQPDFERLYKFIQNKFGINLSQKKHLIESRLSTTISAKGYKSFTPYIDKVLRGDQAYINELLSRLTTNHTYFYRESTHFEYFKKTILPYLEKTNAKTRMVTVWCAASSSGEEPYTLAMILHEYFSLKPQKWDYRVLATDISPKILTKAKMARYKTEDIAPMPEKYRKKYFKIEGDHCTITEEIKKNVVFKQFNLMSPISFKVNFDVIFCRNVMIYFDQDDKNKLVNRFYDVTNEGGFLFIGLSENVNKTTTKYKYVGPATYRKVNLN